MSNSIIRSSPSQFIWSTITEMWRWRQGLTNLVCLSSLVSLFFTSVTFSSSSKSLFPHFIDPSRLTVCTRDVRCWIACPLYFIVLTVRTHDVRNHDKTWMACQLYFIVLTVRTRDVQNHDKTWMACQPYFIVLTVRTSDLRNHDRLQPVWGSLRLAPN